MTVDDRNILPTTVFVKNAPRRAFIPEQVDWGSAGSFYPLDDPSWGIEVTEGDADIFAVTENGWYPLGSLSPGAVIIGCIPIPGWKLGVKKSADVSLRPFEINEEQRALKQSALRRASFLKGLDITLAALSVDAVVARALPPRDFDVLSPGEVDVHREDIMRPINSWVWIEHSPVLDVHCPVTEITNGEGGGPPLSWFGIGKHDWVRATGSATVRVATTGELFDRGLLGRAWAEHCIALLQACARGVALRREEQRDRIDAAAHREKEQLEETGRANRRLSSGGGHERELSDLLGPWGTAIARALWSGGRQQRLVPPAGIVPSLRTAKSFDDLSAIGWVRLRPLKLADGWWHTPHATPFVTRYGPEKVPCTITFKGKRPWIQLWEDVEERPLEREDLAALDAEARIAEAPLPARVTTLRGLFRFALAGSGKDAASLAFYAALVMVLSVITPVLSGLVVGRLVQFGENSVILQIGAVMLLIVLLTAGLQTIQNHLALRIKGRMAQRLGSGIWAKLLALPLSFFESRSPWRLGTVIFNIRQAQETISGAVVTAVMGLMIAIADFFVLAAMSPAMAAFVGVALLAVTVMLACLMFQDSAAQRSYLLAQQEVSGLTLSVLSNMSKLRAAGGEHRVLSRWGRLQREALRHQMMSRRVETWIMVMASVLMPVVIAMVIAAGSATVEDRTRVVTAILASQLLITNFIQFIYVLQMLAPVVPTFEFLRPILNADPESGEGRAQPGELSGEIRLHEVSFRYGGNGPLILDRVSIAIRRGEFVAIVGPSGSGKSTLLRMLIGFDRPDSGSVTYDGQDLAELDVAAVRRQCGIVLQSNGTVSGSIRDNIAGSGSYGESEVWEAAEMAGMADDIQAMPMKLSTNVADGSAGLSGGQRQRLMIARALISRPRIVIFDEATSALDNLTQARVTESMHRLNATRIVVAHRLSTVRDADRIIVIDHGHVVESGTYEELLELNGTFANLAKTQQAERDVEPHA